MLFEAMQLNAHDAHTSVHGLFGIIIAIINDETQTYTYDAFGNHQSSQHNPWRYASKRCDPTGLIYYGKRFYNPTLGRWLTPDPAGYTDSSNLYQYNLNNPNRYIDLYGEEPITITIIIIGAIAAVASEGAAVVGASLVASAAAAAIACYGNQFADYCNRQTREYRAHQEFMDSMTSGYTSYDEEEWKKSTIEKRNHLGPDDNAEGNHSTFKRDPKTGKITHYETHRPQTNPKDPKKWDFEKRYDGSGNPSAKHFNKEEKKYVPEPHVHDPNYPGGIRPPYSWEIPNG